MSVAVLQSCFTPHTPLMIGAEPDILASILDPTVQLALWQRLRPAAFDWIDGLKWDEIDDIDVKIDGPDYSSVIYQHLCGAGYPQTLQGHGLADEISRLSWCFARLMGCEHLRFRLEVIETDACRKFHMDYVKARLLMSLSGPGTQWINLRNGEDAPICQLACGEVGIFKGRLWVEEPAILHRSPPMAGSGKARLLMVLDPVTGAAESEFRLYNGRITHG